MYCPKCGTQNPDYAQSCSACGAVLTSGTQAQGEQIVPKNSGMAITSMVLAILSIFTCMLTALPAIILGIISLVKISGSSGRLKGNGFAITGIALPLVALPIVALMMGILMPALARTRQIAFRMVCGTNLSQLSTAMQMYVNENDGYPTPDKWCDLLIEECNLIPEIFHCRGAAEGTCNYALNKNIYDFRQINSSDIVMIFESQPGWNQVGGPEMLTTENHQGEGCNVVFMDGHVEFVPPGKIDFLKWKPD